MQTGGLHYTYPEFNGLDLGNSQAVATAIARYINRQYGGGQTLPGPGVSLFAQTPAGAQSASPAHGAPQAHGAPPAHGAPLAHGAPPAHGAPLSHGAPPTHGAPPAHGGYSILIFLGEVPQDQEPWRSCSTFVGAHYAFVNSNPDQCGNCREQEELVVEGFVHLNEAIAKHSGLSSYEPSVVVPYLKNNLHWRVQSVSSSLSLVC